MHPIEGVHEVGLILGRPRSALGELQEALCHEEQIVACLLQLRPGASFVAQVPVARGTAAVLRWTLARSARADGLRLARVEWQHPFEADVMLPAVAHVVLVDEPLARP